MVYTVTELKCKRKIKEQKHTCKRQKALLIHEEPNGRNLGEAKENNSGRLPGQTKRGGLLIIFDGLKGLSLFCCFC
jgi:hypothetical protein